MTITIIIVLDKTQQHQDKNVDTEETLKRGLRNSRSQGLLSTPKPYRRVKIEYDGCDAVQYCSVWFKLFNLNLIKCFLLQNVTTPAGRAIHLNTRQNTELSPGQKKTESKSAATR